MGATLDLDDVAATSTTAAKELAEMRALLRDCRRYVEATRAHWEVLADRGRAGSADRRACLRLAVMGKELVARIDAVVPRGAASDGA